jgi:predicted CopG family antitoxin
MKLKRKSISVRGTTYDKLLAFASEHDRSMSDVVEQLLAPLLGTRTPEPVADQVASEARDKRREARLRFNPPPPAPKVALRQAKNFGSLPPKAPPAPSAAAGGNTRKEADTRGRPAPADAKEVCRPRQPGTCVLW